MQLLTQQNRHMSVFAPPPIFLFCLILLAALFSLKSTGAVASESSSAIMPKSLTDKLESSCMSDDLRVIKSILPKQGTMGASLIVFRKEGREQVRTMEVPSELIQRIGLSRGDKICAINGDLD